MTDSEREAVINALIDADHELASYGDLADAAIAALVAERDEARRLAGYDWNVLHAMQASLREHMQRIATLEADLNEARQNAKAYQIGVHAVVKQMESERAALKAESRALREAGEIALGIVPRGPILTAEARAILEGQPGALDRWLGKGVGNG